MQLQRRAALTWLSTLGCILIRDAGGVTPETMAGYIRVGASGFALGSTLYTAGMDTSVLRQKARSFADGWRNGQWLGEGTVKIGEQGLNWTVTMSDGAVLQ